jgi:hypothetical protein
MGGCIKNCSTKISCSLEENSAAECTESNFVKDSLVPRHCTYFPVYDYISLEMKSIVVEYRATMDSVLLVKPVLTFNI